MTSPVRISTLFRFWLPLQATWLMMALEGPFLAAVIARMPDPKYNLAAYGVAFALVILVEAPVIMMMSASTALVDSVGNYRRLRNFMWMLNLGITVVMLGLLLTPFWELLVYRGVGKTNHPGFAPPGRVSETAAVVSAMTESETGGGEGKGYGIENFIWANRCVSSGI